MSSGRIPPPSSHQSPPRKRTRNGAALADASASAGSLCGPSSASGSRRMIDNDRKCRANAKNRHKMRLQKNRSHRQRAASSSNGSSSSSSATMMNLPHGLLAERHSDGGGAGAASQPLGEQDQEPMLLTSQPQQPNSLSAALVRRVKRQNHLSDVDREIVRLIGQHLDNIGLKTSANVLMKEAGCRLDQPTASILKKYVLNGDWSHALLALDDLKLSLESLEHLVEMKFMILEQKYLEHLSRGECIEALKVLQTELTPLKHNRDRTHQLSTYLMYSSPEDIARVTRATANGHVDDSRDPDGDVNHASSDVKLCASKDVASRHRLIERLQAFLPASVMLPPKRLLTLLTQAAEFQTERCLFHNGMVSSPISLDASYLAIDHACSKKDLPCETIQVLSDHSEEVWFCQFSPNGLKLATCSKDSSVLIWDFDPDTLMLKLDKSLDRHNHGVAFCAWSPDSRYLAICGQEDCDKVFVYNVDTNEVAFKVSHNNDDSLTTVSWSPDGCKVACGGSKGQLYQCDTNGVILDSWEGVRVQCVAYHQAGKAVLAADTHHRIRSYNFEELTDTTVLQEDHGIMSFTLDKTERYALVNIATQGLHLWDVRNLYLVRKYVGITQGLFTVYSCFGGQDHNFIASGSEDGKVYVYHVKKETPIFTLPGHSRTVNCVTWNPVYPRVLVSVSDDCTVRVWAPAEKFRKSSTPAASCAPLNNVTAHQEAKHEHQVDQRRRRGRERHRDVQSLGNGEEEEDEDEDEIEEEDEEEEEEDEEEDDDVDEDDDEEDEEEDEGDLDEEDDEDDDVEDEDEDEDSAQANGNNKSSSSLFGAAANQRHHNHPPARNGMM